MILIRLTAGTPALEEPMSFQNRRILDPKQLLCYNEAFAFLAVLVSKDDITIESFEASESRAAPAAQVDPAGAHRMGRIAFPGNRHKSCSRPPRFPHAGSRLGRYHIPALCREGAGSGAAADDRIQPSLWS